MYQDIDLLHMYQDINLLRVMYRDPQGLEVAFSNILNIKQNFKRFLQH